MTPNGSKSVAVNADASSSSPSSSKLIRKRSNKASRLAASVCCFSCAAAGTERREIFSVDICTARLSGSCDEIHILNRTPPVRGYSPRDRGKNHVFMGNHVFDYRHSGRTFWFQRHRRNGDSYRLDSVRRRPHFDDCICGLGPASAGVMPGLRRSRMAAVADRIARWRVSSPDGAGGVAMVRLRPIGLHGPFALYERWRPARLPGFASSGIALYLVRRYLILCA